MTCLFGRGRYRRLHNAIRRVDDSHIIFFEPTVPPPPFPLPPALLHPQPMSLCLGTVVTAVLQVLVSQLPLAYTDRSGILPNLVYC